jgi:polyisoprenoid-binding protein YceI
VGSPRRSSLCIRRRARRQSPRRRPARSTFVGANTFSTANGSFRSWRVTRAEVDPAQPKSGVVEVEVDVASLETGSSAATSTCARADFFDVAKFRRRLRACTTPSLRQERARHPRYRAKFDLSIHGVSKTLDGEFEVTQTSPPVVEAGSR